MVARLGAYYFPDKIIRDKVARELRNSGHKVKVRSPYIITKASGIAVHKAQYS